MGGFGCMQVESEGAGFSQGWMMIGCHSACFSGSRPGLESRSTETERGWTEEGQLMMTGVWTQVVSAFVILVFVVPLVLQENSSPGTHELKPNTEALFLVLVKHEVSVVLTILESQPPTVS